MAQKVNKIFGLLLWENFLPRTWKIAQSGPTASPLKKDLPIAISAQKANEKLEVAKRRCWLVKQL